MARPSKHDGSIYPRKDGKVLWMVYRDRNGKRIRESTFTEDWQEAQRKLRERLQSRDDRILDVVRKGVTVRKKLLPANPCAGVEFPVKAKGLFRPHYMAWSEQQRLETRFESRFESPDREPTRFSAGGVADEWVTQATKARRGEGV